MSAAGHALTRLRSLQAARGWLGLMGFLMTRLARTQSDVLFERETAEAGRSAADEDFGPGRRLVVVGRGDLDDPENRSLLAQLLSGESAVYRAGLARDDMALAIVDEQGSVLHRSFIQFETRYKSILDETEQVPLITHCQTVAKARGERLYPKTLRAACALLAKQGHARAIITCDAANTASIRGIRHAGFRESRAITSIVLLFRLVLQRIRWSDGHLTRRVTWI